jgi:hypothetical protein
MISLANADRGRKGYPSLGFINPLLYSNGDRGYLSENMPSRIPTTSPSTQTDASIVRYLRRDAPSRSSNVTEVSTQGLFHDITEGNNNCCSAAASIDSLSSSAICCDEGYSATTGWDAVSGMNILSSCLFPFFKHRIIIYSRLGKYRFSAFFSYLTEF